MWKHIRRICIDLVFITIIYLVSYSNRDPNAIRQVLHIKALFLNTRSSTNNFEKVKEDNWTFLWTQFFLKFRLYRSMIFGNGWRMCSSKGFNLKLGIMVNQFKIWQIIWMIRRIVSLAGQSCDRCVWNTVRINRFLFY